MMSEYEEGITTSEAQPITDTQGEGRRRSQCRWGRVGLLLALIFYLLYVAITTNIIG